MENADIVAKVRKLLAVSVERGATEAEAETASRLVQKILADHNIEMSMLEAKDEKPQHETRKKTDHNRAAMYKYQRTLMAELARNNFCMHFIEERVAESFGKIRTVKRHVLLGRRVNIDVTMMTYDYLVDTMDRILPYTGMEKRGKSALLWLEGCADRLSDRLRKARYEAEAESRSRAKDEATRARHPGAAPSTGTILVLADVYGSEEDLNNDAINGLEPGTTAARKREANARYEAKRAQMKSLEDQGISYAVAFKMVYYSLTQAEAEAEVASDKIKQAEYEKAEARKAGRRKERVYRETAADRRRYSDEYQAGSRAGEGISLNTQVGSTMKERIR